MADDGKISWVLLPMKNQRGEYWMGNSRLGSQLDLSSLVLFARTREDGALIVTAEQHDPRAATPAKGKKS